MCPTPAPPARVLYLISCASMVARRVEPVVETFQRAGWSVCSILTPQATRFVDRERLAALTGHPVRSEYKRPEEPDVLPRADALLVYPATFNSINKWAHGASDTLALGLIAEYTGYRAPIVAVPCVRNGSGLDSHPVFLESLRRLRSWGIEVLHEPETYAPINEVPPGVLLRTVDRLVSERARAS